MTRLKVLFAFAAAASALVACAADPIQEAPNDEDDQTAQPQPASNAATPPKKDGAGGAEPDKCPYDGPPIDVSPFPTCGDGGRCVPKGTIPEKERSRLAECPSGYCVPEKIIKSKGGAIPTACHGLAGAEGRCYSVVFPDIDKNKDHLPIDVCDKNERCVPCYDPVTGEETPVCHQVACDAPKEKKVVFGDCCGKPGATRGRCVPKSTMSADEASHLAQKECADKTDVCVPNEQLKDGYVPPKCTATALIGKYDGVCFSDCIPRDFFASIGTAKGSCGDGFFCAPCKNPLTGKSTGAPGCGP
jgi:hypothetical protein